MARGRTGISINRRRRHNDRNSAAFASDVEELWRINWKESGLPYCGIYIVTTDSLYPCKIGISQNPGKRLASLQTSHWRLLQISDYRWCESKSEARKIERLTHKHFKENNKLLHGEWFDTRPKEAAEALDWVGVAEGIAVNKHVPDCIKLEFYIENLGRQNDVFLNRGD
jgi:hypothetical protein